MDGSVNKSANVSRLQTKILIVDDSLLMRTMLSDAIDKDSCSVRLAGNGFEALEKIYECCPDVVLLDQEMPRLRGNDLLKALKSDERTRDISVVMVTGSSDAKMIEESLDLGAIEFIAKPFSEGVLKARIRNVVRTNVLIREQKLLRADADAANRSKSQFLANMSHEIRTPMTAILGFAEIVLGNVTDPQNVDGLQTIQRNGQYLLQIINDILDLSKIESGKLEVEQIECSPRQVLNDVVSLMNVRAQAKGLTLEIKYDGPTPKQIISDPTRLRQILINLVGNSIKFTEVGSVQIVVRVLEADSAAPSLQFDVVDCGIGMTEKQVDNLFQPFVQADTSTTRRFGGTGLGLTISKRLAEMLGGDIAVRSIAGEGSTFSVMVRTGPLAGVAMIDEASEATTPAEPKKKTAANLEELNCRVLLAEDGPDNQRLISFILKKAGAEVRVADNGQIALDLALKSLADAAPFDVILMDMQMPVLDGYAATRKLREAGYAGPIIALTAHAMSADRAKCLAAGCNDYTTKPIDRAKLIALVAQYAPQPARDAAEASLA